MSMLPAQVKRVAFIARVSTDEQADRNTVQNQLDFLRDFGKLYGLSVYGEYVDEGWSGTIPLDQRPAGRRLLEDARAGYFQTVICYRIDRISRSLFGLLEAHRALEAAGVSIQSATEPVDGSTPIGKFLFHLLGSMAELERSTITERTVMGRQRKIREGVWTQGVPPYGYDLDDDRRLIPSTRLAGDQTEAEIAQSIFQQVADGVKTGAISDRLNALGIPTVRHTRQGGTRENLTPFWLGSRIVQMVHNPVYRGVRVSKSRGSQSEQPCPALVSTGLWERANARLVTNRDLSRRDTDRLHILRGLVKCGDCGASYSGGAGRPPLRYYFCGFRGRAAARQHPVCRGKLVPAQDLEDLVWARCREHAANPDASVAGAERQAQERLVDQSLVAGERARLERSLAEKDDERERMLGLFRKGLVTVDQIEGQLQAIQKESAGVREMLAALQAQSDSAEAVAAQVVSARQMLTAERARIDEADRTGDPMERRRIFERLVRRVTIFTDGERNRKTYRVKLEFVLGAGSDIGVTCGLGRDHFSYVQPLILTELWNSTNRAAKPSVV